MKDLKKKLTAAAAMLVVSAVMLSGVSYAWYTLSTNPEVKGITATATSNANLEIAYNELTTAPDAKGEANTTGSYDRYGNLVVMDGANGNTSSQSNWRNLEKVLRPMTYDNEFKYMQYGADGRPSALNTLAVTTGNNNACGNIQLQATGKDAVNYGYYIRYWMRTNVVGDLYLSKAAKRSNDSASEIGNGTTITVKSNQSSVSDANLAELAKNIKLGFSTGDSAVNTGVTTIDASTWTADTNSTGQVVLTMANDTDTTIDLVQNTDTQVFMYVYLDGTNLSNALANALKDGSISVEVNAQFSNNTMNDEMGMTSTGSTTAAP